MCTHVLHVGARVWVFMHMCFGHLACTCFIGNFPVVWEGQSVECKVLLLIMYFIVVFTRQLSNLEAIKLLLDHVFCMQSACIPILVHMSFVRGAHVLSAWTTCISHVKYVIACI